MRRTPTRGGFAHRSSWGTKAPLKPERLFSVAAPGTTIPGGSGPPTATGGKIGTTMPGSAWPARFHRRNAPPCAAICGSPWVMPWRVCVEAFRAVHVETPAADGWPGGACSCSLRATGAAFVRNVLTARGLRPLDPMRQQQATTRGFKR